MKYILNSKTILLLCCYINVFFIVIDAVTSACDKSMPERVKAFTRILLHFPLEQFFIISIHQKNCGPNESQQITF